MEEFFMVKARQRYTRSAPRSAIFINFNDIVCDKTSLSSGPTENSGNGNNVALVRLSGKQTGPGQSK